MFSRSFVQASRVAARSYATQASTVQAPLKLHGLAGKYAASAWTAAAKKDVKLLDKVEADLKAINQALMDQQNQKIRDIIENPTLSAKAKIAGLQEIYKVAAKGQVTDITKNLFEVLAENGRLHDAPKVIEDFLRLQGAYRGEVEVTITSATPLDKSLSSRLESALKQSKLAADKKQLKITNKVQPTILGGIVVDFGGQTIDLSVASRVNKLNSLLQESI